MQGMTVAVDIPSFFLMKLNSSLFKGFTVFLIVTAVVYGGYLLFRGASSLDVPTLFPKPLDARLLMSMEGFRFTHAENGTISWRMNSRSADLYENKEAKLKEIEILFTSADPSDNNKKEALLLGEQGTMDTLSGNASISRGTREVRIATSDGYLLTTNSLFWKAGERVVWTKDPFKLLGKEIYLEGVGVVANVDMRTIMVKKNVKAVLQE